MSRASSKSALFIDQSGEIGGAELSMLDIVNGRDRVDTVALLADGPFAELLRENEINLELAPLSVAVNKRSSLLAQVTAVPRVIGVARRLARLGKRHAVIIANTQKAAVIGALAARFSGVPLIWHLRDMLDAEHFSSANRRAVVALTNRWGKHVIANSQATADAYHHAGGRLPITVVYNGLPSAPYAALADQDIAAVRRDLGLPDDETLVGVFGRLTPWKGQDVLLTALAHDDLADLHAIVVGEALFTDEDRGYAERLRAEVAGGPLAGRVHFLGHRSDVPALMKACDIIAHTSTSPEPFGRVIVEGMLAQTPVIATNAGGAREILTDGENGLLVTPDDADALRQAIKRLVSDRVFASQLGDAGQLRAQRCFSVEQVVEGVNHVMDQITSTDRETRSS